MNLKKLILAGVGIASLAGTAEAVELKVTKIADVLKADYGAAPLKVASEMAQGTTALANNDRDETVAVVTGSVSSGTFPTGNTVVTMTISGATFDAAVTGGAVSFAKCTTAPTGSPDATATLSSGGGEGATQVKWVFSDLNDCGPGQVFEITTPLDLDLGGAGVSVSLNIVTEGSGTPVDGGTADVNNFITTNNKAYSTVITAGTNATADVASALPPYSDFLLPPGLSSGTLGNVQLKADTTVAIDISGTQEFAAIANYGNSTVTLAGDLSAYLGAGDTVELDGLATASKTPTSATFAAVNGGDFGGIYSNAASAPIEFTVDGDTAIQTSCYTVAVTPGLSITGMSAPAATAATAISCIGRNGSFARLPWVVSGTQAGPTASNTGAVNYIRVTNPTPNAYGKISARVIATNNAGSLNATATLADSLAPGGELLVNSGTLETLLGDNYGRGDIELTVEGVRATIVQLVARPDGVYTIDNTPYEDGNSTLP